MRRPRPTSLAAVTALGMSLGALTGCLAIRDTGPAGHGISQPGPNQFGLFYSQTPQEGAKLVYGAPNSDDVRLMLDCMPGSGRIEVIQAYGPAHDSPMTLSSGFSRTRLAGKAEDDGETGEKDAIAWTTPRSAALRQFRRSGRLVVSGPGYRSQVAVKTAERQAVGRFFQACGAL